MVKYGVNAKSVCSAELCSAKQAMQSFTVFALNISVLHKETRGRQRVIAIFFFLLSDFPFDGVEETVHPVQ